MNLTQYNNSLYENIGIHIVNISGLNKYTIQYEDNIATYRMKKAHVEQTAKGIYFANVTPAEFLDLKRYTPQLCCDWDKPHENSNLSRTR